MTRAAIGIGSNLEHRLTYLQQAVEGLAQLGELRAVSSLYETAPVGGPPQGPYLNAVAVLETSLSAPDLLTEIQRLEAGAGRTREVRFGPRTLDLDLLVFDAETFDTPDLVVPHPRLAQRRFVLEPLVEVWPDPPLPQGKAATLLAGVSDQPLRLVAREWTRGVPVLLDRGTGWVVAQAGLLVAWLAVTVASGDLPFGSAIATWAGAAGLAAGAWLMVRAATALGPSLSPRPAPGTGSSLTEAGPYRWLRHPMYLGVVLALAGTATFFTAWWGVGAAVLLGVFFGAKAVNEENRLGLCFPGYAGYRERVRYRLIPGLF
jgi:2-amino-4-hydroxy-6-hydroxymethyldihydropteridine diphosphokinase